MSIRPNWFRFVTTLILVLVSTSLLSLSAYSQEVTTSAVEATVKTTDESKAGGELLEEIFPYLSKPPVFGDDPTSLISAGTYAFATQAGVPLESMSSGTTQLVGASQDDTASALADIGFEFWLDGARFTQFSVNPNGLMKLGSPVVNNGTNGRTNNLATANDLPKIAAYWDDLCTTAAGKVHYKV